MDRSGAAACRNRQAAGFSQHQLAHLTKYSRSSIANAETGRQRAPREFWQTCDDVLGTATALARGYDGVIAVMRRMHMQEAAVAQRSRIASHDNGAGPLLLADAYAGSQPGLPGLELARVHLTAVLAEGAMSPESLEAWEQASLLHGEATRYELPQDVLVVLGADLAELDKTLRQCRAAGSVRRLTRVAAQLSGLACLLVVRLDERDESCRWAQTARIAAVQADDAPTLSWVLAQEAYGHFYAGRLDEAITVARHAQELMRTAPCVGAVTAAALEARAHASRGEGREAKKALARTEIILNKLNPEQMTASAFGYTEAQFRFHESSAYTRLGEVRAALAAQDRALALCRPDDYTDWALTRLDRASCIARQGDPGTAVKYAISTIQQLGAEQRQGIITARSAELARTLPAICQTSPAARELRDLMHPSALSEEL